MENIESVQLGADGKIYVELNRSFGPDKVLLFSHKKIMGGMNIRSSCVTNFSVKVTRSITGCKTDTTLRMPK